MAGRRPHSESYPPPLFVAELDGGGHTAQTEGTASSNAAPNGQLIYEMPAEAVQSPDQEHHPRPARQTYDDSKPAQANPWPFYLDDGGGKEVVAVDGEGSGMKTGENQDVAQGSAHPWPYHGPGDDVVAPSVKPQGSSVSKPVSESHQENLQSSQASSGPQHPAPLSVGRPHAASTTSSPTYKPYSPPADHEAQCSPPPVSIHNKPSHSPSFSPASSQSHPTTSIAYRPYRPPSASPPGSSPASPNLSHSQTLPGDHQPRFHEGAAPHHFFVPVSAPQRPPASGHSSPQNVAGYPHTQSQPSSPPLVSPASPPAQHPLAHFAAPSHSLSGSPAPHEVSRPTSAASHSPRPHPLAQFAVPSKPSSVAQAAGAAHHTSSSHHSPFASPSHGPAQPTYASPVHSSTYPTPPQQTPSPSSSSYFVSQPSYAPGFSATPPVNSSPAHKGHHGPTQPSRPQPSQGGPQSPPPPPYSSVKPNPGALPPASGKASLFGPPPPNMGYAPAQHPPQPTYTMDDMHHYPHSSHSQGGLAPPPLPPRPASAHGQKPMPTGFGSGAPSGAAFPRPPKTNYTAPAPPSSTMGGSYGRPSTGKVFSGTSAKKWLDKTGQVLEQRLGPMMQTQGGSQQRPYQGQSGSRPAPPPRPGTGTGTGQYPGAQPPRGNFHSGPFPQR